PIAVSALAMSRRPLSNTSLGAPEWACASPATMTAAQESNPPAKALGARNDSAAIAMANPTTSLRGRITKTPIDCPDHKEIRALLNWSGSEARIILHAVTKGTGRAGQRVRGDSLLRQGSWRPAQSWRDCRRRRGRARHPIGPGPLLVPWRPAAADRARP